MHNVSHLSLIDNDATRKNINNLIKIQKRSFFMLNQENGKNVLDTSNDEPLLLSSNRRSESVFDSSKRESLASCGHQNGKRRKRRNWFYYKSSSNETNRGLDDDDRSTSRGNSVCALDRGDSYVESKRKGKGEDKGEGNGVDNGVDNRDHKGDGPFESSSGCDSAGSPSRSRRRTSKKARSPKGRQPPDGRAKEAAEGVAEEVTEEVAEKVAEEAAEKVAAKVTAKAAAEIAAEEDSCANSRMPSESRAYVRTVTAGESGTEFHSFDVEEEVDAMATAPAVAVDPPEKNQQKEERQINTNALFTEETKSPGRLTKNTKVYQENVEEYNSEFKSIISEPLNPKEGREKIKRRRDHNRETQMMYLNKILKSIVNKEKSHLNSLSKNFERIEGFYKQNYKIYIIESKDDLNDKRNCFKSDLHAYVLSPPPSDDISNELNILDQFKMYLRRCRGDYRPRKYQTHITTGGGKAVGEKPAGGKPAGEKPAGEKPVGGGNSGVNLQTNASCTEKKEHSSDNCPGEDHAGGNAPQKEGEQRGAPMKSSLTKMAPKGKNAEVEDVGETEAGEIEAGETSRSSPQREAGKTHPTNQSPPENGIIFYAHNKKNPSSVKELREGDCLYIKFNYSYDDYDKIRVVKKEDLLQILICLMRNQECLKLSHISTYSPDLLWNLSVHFKNNTYDMELNLEKMYAHFCRRYEVTSPDGRPGLDLQLGFAPLVERAGDHPFGGQSYLPFDVQSHLPFDGQSYIPFDSQLGGQPGCSPEWSPDRWSDRSSEAASEAGARASRSFKSAKRAKRENLKEMEIMKLKDYVSFLDKFLQNVNDAKLKRLKNIQKEYYKKYEFDRSINKLSRQQLLELFVDRKNEMNTIPLSFLKEKSRNIIYEENIKMNMFACIKITFDEVKGRCIYAASDLNKFDFVFEYVGELLTHNEAMERERKYNKNKKKGCYMFYFKHENKRYCIDGTEENIDAAINSKDKKYFLRSFARLVNHSKKNSNLIPKVLTVASLPRLFFVAARNIKEGEELLIDYGERDREIIKNNEWLKC
ncbi:hypothetical protein PVNG_02956 [Plasmodium vivax North Korean]|nr:hypothetical protein PVNG_02956 [Plasmodium vivax North Korean]